MAYRCTSHNRCRPLSGCWNGRQASLRSWCPYGRAGSTPAPETFSFYVTPCFPLDDTINGCRSNTQHPPDAPVRLTLFGTPPYQSNLPFSQDRNSHSFAVRRIHPAFALHIQDIVLRRTNEKMIRSNTYPIIASMENPFLIRDLIVPEQVCNAVRLPYSPVDFDCTVPRSCGSSPFPTVSSPLDFSPKPSKQFRGGDDLLLREVIGKKHSTTPRRTMAVSPHRKTGRKPER